MSSSEALSSFIRSIQSDIDSDRYNLYREFDFNKHAASFPYYCEVIVDKNGKVYYATPSHTMFAEVLYAVEHNLLTEDYLLPHKTLERQLSFVGERVSQHQKDRGMFESSQLDNILVDLGIVLVWYDRVLHKTKLTDKQIDVLNKLVETECCSKKVLEILL